MLLSRRQLLSSISLVALCAPTCGQIVQFSGAGGVLPLTSRLSFGDNSYGTQIGSIDYLEYAWMAVGCRGVPTLGFNQSRGGDTLVNLHDRWAPIAAVKAAIVGTMNIENDLAGVSNDASGGAVLLARADQIIADARAAGEQVVLYKQPNTNTAIGSKSIATGIYNSGLNSRAATDVFIFDQGTYFNPQDTTQSLDGVHPNVAKGAKALGEGLGALIASKFTSAGIFDAGGQLSGNFNPNWNMGSAGTLMNLTSGLTVVQTADFLRSQPSVACRKLAISGTCSADPTSTGDIQLRFASPHAGGTDTIGKTVTAFALIEISDSAGNDPQNLATIQLQASLSTAFSKTYNTANDPWNNGKKFTGPIGILRNTILTSQSLTCNIDFIVRALQVAGVDIEVRIAYLNCLYIDDTAYGPVTNASAVFTVGRPVLFALPTTTPTSGPLAVSNTLGVGASLARFIGGGLTRTYDAMRDGVTDVGDAVPATAAGAAVPYTVVAGDSGHMLAIRNNASNAFSGESSAAVNTAELSVT